MEKAKDRVRVLNFTHLRVLVRAAFTPADGLLDESVCDDERSERDDEGGDVGLAEH
jgi:hypothetical protein